MKFQEMVLVQLERNNMEYFDISVEFNVVKFHIALENKRWNLKKLSLVTGIAYDTIKKYSSGQYTPSARCLYIISKALSVSMESLMKEVFI